VKIGKKDKEIEVPQAIGVIRQIDVRYLLRSNCSRGFSHVDNLLLCTVTAPVDGLQ